MKAVCWGWECVAVGDGIVLGKRTITVLMQLAGSYVDQCSSQDSPFCTIKGVDDSLTGSR